LRDSSRPQEALDLLEELFPQAESLEVPEAQSYSLYCLAGELCSRYLNRPLDAIDYYERALQFNATAPTAFREELALISTSRHHPALSAMIQSDASIAQNVDEKLRRNYSVLFGDRQTHAESEDDELIDRQVADYFLWRGQFPKAQQFILSRLFDEQNHYVWWDLELMISYVWSFLGLETGDGRNLTLAREQLQQVKDGLRLLSDSSPSTTTLFEQVGPEIAELDLLIAARLADIQKAPTRNRFPNE
jgi:hypothetical protein